MLSLHRRFLLNTSTFAITYVVVTMFAGCNPGTNFAVYEVGEELSGGATTVFDRSRNAFTFAARNLKGARRDRFFVGNSLFNRAWVTAPSSTSGLDGLGPTFNANSCSSCHFKDGRGAPPANVDEEFVGLLLRLSVSGEDEHGGPRPEPNYGGQFNHRSILGVTSEGKSQVIYTEVQGQFTDGTPYSLRKPKYVLTDLAYGPLADDVMISPRIAPAVIGLGLLEAIEEHTIRALADEHDEDGNGISGRVNEVWDPKSKTTQLGRYGWKANQAGLEQQNAGAFLGDLGITSPLFPTENCPEIQTDCLSAQHGGTPEVDQDKIDDMTYYSRLLAVPARRDVEDETVLRGKGLFHQLGCASCHQASFTTGTLEGFPELSQQEIRPYTDLLLHDMGEELADHRPDYRANGREWRTPPLWGIGLVSTVNQHTNFLHDGRARNLTEAILWHGGEAEVSRESFRELVAEDRSALIRFLESL